MLADISLFHPFVLRPREDGLSLPPLAGLRLMLFPGLAGLDVGAKLHSDSCCAMGVVELKSLRSCWCSRRQLASTTWALSR